MKESCQCELTLNSTQSLTSSILLTGDSFIYKTSHILYQSLPVFASQKLAGFAEFAQICDTTPTRNRDANGNRTSKTTPWGTVKYAYDKENRMTESGDLGKSESVKYTYDANGNLLSEVAGRYQKDYVYNAQNRMTFSEVLDRAENTRNLTEYRYDAFGRRIETIEYLGDHTRNLFDGFSFDIAEKTVLQTHAAATMPEQKYRAGGAGANSSHPELGSGSAAGRSGAGIANGTRYRYIGDEPLVPLENAGGNTGAQASSSANGAAKTRSRPNAEYVLYSNGEPVAMSADGDTSYFGTDILGSVRSVTDKYGNVKASYEYDAFGSPYLANLENDVGFGYCGKVYDSATGLYDYGFRDYSPNSARFTTVDPVRDGSNWFSYVVNDPVNYIDPFGLTPYDVPNQTYLGDKDGKSYFRVDEGGTKWGLANATGTPLNEVNGYDGVAESMPIGTILSIPSQINNSGTTPSNSNNAINTSPAITAQSFSQSSNFASVGMSGGTTSIYNPFSNKTTTIEPVRSPVAEGLDYIFNKIQQENQPKIYAAEDPYDNNFFANHQTPLAAVQQENGVATLYAQAGANFDIKNGNFNVNATTGVATITIPVLDIGNYIVEVNLQALTASVLLGLQNKRLGYDIDFSICKGGIILTANTGNRQIKITGEFSIGLGKSLLFSFSDGWKAGGANGYGGSVNLEINDKEGD